jgi:arsenate reductase (thioredoxin)
VTTDHLPTDHQPTDRLPTDHLPTDHLPTDHLPTVLFLCVHNAGRSQMALGWFETLAGDRALAYSGGSEPADQVNPAAVEAMTEVGIDLAGYEPKRWTDDMVRTADVVVTMGCGDSCPVFPGTRYEDWALADPAGMGVDAVRPIRDEIGERVRDLLARLDVAID